MKTEQEDLKRVLKEYFKYRAKRLGREYTFHVRMGWSYEGIDLYAFDVIDDWYLREHIPPEDVALAETDGFKHIGKHITTLKERLYVHEETYQRGYH